MHGGEFLQHGKGARGGLRGAHSLLAPQNALKNKIRSKEKKASWLDYADDAKYSESLRNDIRAVGRVLLLFVPLPVFWALYDQQGSRWTFQVRPSLE